MASEIEVGPALLGSMFWRCCRLQQVTVKLCYHSGAVKRPKDKEDGIREKRMSVGTELQGQAVLLRGDER